MKRLNNIIGIAECRRLADDVQEEGERYLREIASSDEESSSDQELINYSRRLIPKLGFMTNNGVPQIQANKAKLFDVIKNYINTKKKTVPYFKTLSLKRFNNEIKRSELADAFYHVLRNDHYYAEAQEVLKLMKDHGYDVKCERNENAIDLYLYNEMQKYWDTYNLDPNYIQVDTNPFGMYQTVLYQAQRANNFPQIKFLSRLLRYYQSNLLNSGAVEWAYIDIAEVYVSVYDRIITRYTRPNSDMMEALVQAKRHYECVPMDHEDAMYYKHSDVRDKYYDLITFFLDTPQLSKFLQSRAESFYCHIEENKVFYANLLLCQSYAKSQSTKDLYNQLKAKDFALIWWEHPVCNTYQHIWVNKEGVQIRIKPFAQEVTIGFTHTNPIVWPQLQTDAKTIKIKENGSFFIDDEYNEVLKFSKGCITPAFTTLKVLNRQDFPQWDSEVKYSDRTAVMDDGHYMSIVQPLSDPNKNFCYKNTDLYVHGKGNNREFSYGPNQVSKQPRYKW